MRRLIQSVLGKLGYRLVRLETTKPLLENFFFALKELGFAPKQIMDVGANRGGWTRRAVEFFPDARYTLVEPQDELKVHIQDLLAAGHKIQWINVGAGDTAGELAFTISHRDDSSSFALSREEADTSGYPQVIRPVRTLNEIVATSGAPPPEMIKIDAEGFDLKVLAGASDLLGKTDIVFVEVGVCSGKIENSMAKTVSRMAEAGYQVMDITDLNRSPKHNVLWLCELAFVRKDSHLLDSITSYE
ncbi:MAG: FkbM family methyltransferase [Verrucomicrobiia bacterium]